MADGRAGRAGEFDAVVVEVETGHRRAVPAEQIAGGADINEILHPDAGTSPAERAWHYFLPSLNSGYMYYGTSLDMEVKATLACNKAVAAADPIIAGGADDTAPTVWLPQRLPWNPGGHGGGRRPGGPGGRGGAGDWAPSTGRRAVATHPRTAASAPASQRPAGLARTRAGSRPSPGGPGSRPS